jgi:hypothetical protein
MRSIIRLIGVWHKKAVGAWVGSLYGGNAGNGSNGGNELKGPEGDVKDAEFKEKK